MELGLYIQRWGDSGDPTYGDLHRYDYKSYCTDVTKFPRPRFASEFGFQAYPSFYSLSQVSEKEVKKQTSIPSPRPLMHVCLYVSPTPLIQMCMYVSPTPLMHVCLYPSPAIYVQLACSAGLGQQFHIHESSSASS